MLLVPLLLSLAQVAPAPSAPAFQAHHGGRLFISPMGEPFRPKGREDDGLADWFAQADANHDGKLTLDEMQKDSERFFAVLDVNHDGEIDPDEIAHYEEVIAPEIRTGQHYDLDALEGRGDQGGDGSGSHRGRGKGFFRSINTDQHQGAGRYGLLDLPEPVISADTDFNRGVSLAEFRAAAQVRFMALDLDHKGYLTLEGLETVRPAPPPAPNTPNNGRAPNDSDFPASPG